MKLKKNFLINIFLFLLSFNSLANAETLTFGSSIYEGEVKRGKASGQGILTFSDETRYEGNFKRNKPHGSGVYFDQREDSFEGKWKYGKLKVKLDKKTRRIIKISAEEGQTNFFEIRGTGQLFTKWFEAEQNSEGEFVLSKKGIRDMEAEKKKALDHNAAGSGQSWGIF